MGRNVFTLLHPLSLGFWQNLCTGAISFNGDRKKVGWNHKAPPPKARQVDKRQNWDKKMKYTVKKKLPNKNSKDSRSRRVAFLPGAELHLLLFLTLQHIITSHMIPVKIK